MKSHVWLGYGVCFAACLVMGCADGQSHWAGLHGFGGFVLEHHSGTLIVTFEYYTANSKKQPGPVLVYEDTHGAPVPIDSEPGRPPLYSVRGKPLPTSAVVLFDTNRQAVTVLADRWDTGMIENPDAFRGFLEDLLGREGYDFH